MRTAPSTKESTQRWAVKGHKSGGNREAGKREGTGWRLTRSSQTLGRRKLNLLKSDRRGVPFPERKWIRPPCSALRLAVLVLSFLFYNLLVPFHKWTHNQTKSSEQPGGLKISSFLKTSIYFHPGLGCVIVRPKLSSIRRTYSILGLLSFLRNMDHILK